MPRAPFDLRLGSYMNQNDRLTLESITNLWPRNYRVCDPSSWPGWSPVWYSLSAHLSQRGFLIWYWWVLHQRPVLCLPTGIFLLCSKRSGSSFSEEEEKELSPIQSDSEYCSPFYSALHHIISRFTCSLIKRLKISKVGWQPLKIAPSYWSPMWKERTTSDFSGKRLVSQSHTLLCP